MSDEKVSHLVDCSTSRAALDRIRARASASGLRFDWEAVKADRDAGRPGEDKQKPKVQVDPVPLNRSWDSFLESGPTASSDFMENVEDLQVQERE